jgi:hypothetical protein
MIAVRSSDVELTYTSFYMAILNYGNFIECKITKWHRGKSTNNFLSNCINEEVIEGINVKSCILMQLDNKNSVLLRGNKFSCHKIHYLAMKRMFEFIYGNFNVAVNYTIKNYILYIRSLSSFNAHTQTLLPSWHNLVTRFLLRNGCRFLEVRLSSLTKFFR